MAQESEKSNRETKPDASPKPIRGVLEFLIKFVAQVSREMSNITTHSCDRTIIMLGVLERKKEKPMWWIEEGCGSGQGLEGGYTTRFPHFERKPSTSQLI
jgi:hypothetical protein